LSNASDLHASRNAALLGAPLHAVYTAEQARATPGRAGCPRTPPTLSGVSRLPARQGDPVALLSEGAVKRGEG
ncbi:hypothetical protein ABZ630_25700, partial [Streptomyces albidoflavus]